jgi:hypothetical protein
VSIIVFRTIDSPVGLLTLAGRERSLGHLRMVGQTHEPSRAGWERDDDAFPDAVSSLAPTSPATSPPSMSISHSRAHSFSDAYGPLCRLSRMARPGPTERSPHRSVRPVHLARSDLPTGAIRLGSSCRVTE